MSHNVLVFPTWRAIRAVLQWSERSERNRKHSCYGMRASARLPPILPISRTAAFVHDGLDPNEVVQFPVDHRERKPTTKGFPVRSIQRAANARILTDVPENPLNLVEKILPQSCSTLFVEGDRFP